MNSEADKPNLIQRRGFNFQRPAYDGSEAILLL
jgi:hypothetical protein